MVVTEGSDGGRFHHPGPGAGAGIWPLYIVYGGRKVMTTLTRLLLVTCVITVAQLPSTHPPPPARQCTVYATHQSRIVFMTDLKMDLKVYLMD